MMECCPAAAPAPSPTPAVDPSYVKAIIWSENIILSIAGLAMALAPLYRLSGMLSRKAKVPDELLCLAGIVSLAVVVFNFFGSAIGLIAGEPPHFVSQVFFAIVVGGATKLHTLEGDQIKMVLDAVCFALAVVASAPTVGFPMAGGGVLVGWGIGFLLGTLTISNTVP